MLYIIITYVYFLIFAQFAFLELAKSSFQEINQLNYVMAAMGISGIFSSFATAILLKKYKKQNFLIFGFLGCAVGGLLSIFITTLWQYIIISIIIGTFLGATTVTLATSLDNLIIKHNFGLKVGIGTGVAYWICNLPIVFTASPSQQTLFAAILCLVGAAILKINSTKLYDPVEVIKIGDVRDHSGKRFAIVVAAFLALIWLDSAAFYVIQQTTGLKTITWEGADKLWWNGAIHLCFALIAGRSIDRGYIWELLVGAYLFLTIGVLTLASNSLVEFAAPFYVAGVSLYSTLLVAFPSLGFDKKNSISKRWQAGTLYAVAGWFGSAMGIGMASDLNEVPNLFLMIAGIFIVVSWLSRNKLSKDVATSVLIFSIFIPVLDAQAQTSVERGRQVYIQEGCINCHSQYVRPNTIDVEMWGPYQNPSSMRLSSPLLIGNRRNGPDLLNVGTRRSHFWQKTHLINPRSLSHNSNMPSYEYLFKDSRGEDLVAYLNSLGANFFQERLNFIAEWRPKQNIDPIKIKEAKKLFQQFCVNCHGKSGKGNGTLSQQIFEAENRKVIDLTKLSSLIDSTEKQKLRNYYSRIIKFGKPGTSMPGHEYFSDSEIFGLIDYLYKLSNK